MKGTMHPLARDYLERLAGYAGALPPHERSELLAELRSHLESGLAPDSTDAEVRNMLDGLGSPEDIVAAAQQEIAPADRSKPSTSPPATSASNAWGPLELAAVMCLTVGSFVAPIVGPVVGLVFAWASPRWTRSEKWVASLIASLAVLILLGAALENMFSAFFGSDSSDVGPGPAPYIHPAPSVVPAPPGDS